MKSQNNDLSFLGGSAGAQGSFLEKCGVFALPPDSGACGSTEAQQHRPSSGPPSRTPAHSQTPREHKSSGISEKSSLHSRTPEESATGRIRRSNDTDQWERDAKRVIAELPDAAVREALVDFYDESVKGLQLRGKSLAQAQQEAFGLLLYCILKSGTEIPVLSRK